MWKCNSVIAGVKMRQNGVKMRQNPERGRWCWRPTGGGEHEGEEARQSRIDGRDYG